MRSVKRVPVAFRSTFSFSFSFFFLLTVLSVTATNTGAGPGFYDLTDNEVCVPHLLPSVPVPTLGRMALLLMMLLMIATAGSYFRSGNGRRIS